MAGLLKRDDGFTLVEVLFAVVIFLIGFLALMTFMEVNMVSSAKAKEKAALVNAAADYVEQVRRLPYTSIGTSSGTPSGSLAETTSTANGFTIHIVPTVTWIDDPRIDGTQDYKRLDLAMTAYLGSPGSMTMSYSTTTLISRSGSGGATAIILPTVSFTADSPASDDVISDTVTVGGEANANGLGVNLTNLNFYVDNVPLISSFGFTSQWPATGPTAAQTFQWDTRAVDASGTPWVTDGWHTLKIETWDSNGQVASVQRSVYIANHAPTTPASLSLNSTTATTIIATWPASSDGSSLADHYLLYGYKQGTTDSANSLALWTVGGPTTATAATATFTGSTSPAVTPFSRYYFTVASFGPSDLTTGEFASAVTISRPLLSGVETYWTNGKTGSTRDWTDDVTLTFSAPEFPSSSCVVTIKRATNAAMTTGLTTVETLSGAPWTYIAVQQKGTGKTTVPVQYYYQAQVVVTPLGYLGGTSQTIMSNVVGPSGTVVGSGINLPQTW